MPPSSVVLALTLAFAPLAQDEPPEPVATDQPVPPPPQQPQQQDQPAPADQPAEAPQPEQPGESEQAAPTGDLADAYTVFRQHFDAGRYEEALPVAIQVVQLCEQRYGPRQMELVIPLTNLGVTQLRLETYFDAEETFRRAVDIVEEHEGGVSPDVIRPLLGLGATYAAAGQHQDAITHLRRALDVSRKIDGLFNLQQIQILEPLIRSYAALELELDAEREREYALRVAETAYGKDDIRMIPVLSLVARWYEEVERYYGARQLHNRALELIAKTHPDTKARDVKDPRMVEHLRAIARNHRLEYLYGGKFWSTNERQQSAPVVTRSSAVGRQPINEEGRQALERALEILKADSQATPAQRGAVLLELGDYYLTGGSDNKAFETYGEAWKELLAAGDTSAMESPVQLVYERPSGALLKPPAIIADYDRFFVEVEFTVSPEGKVSGVKVLQSDATDRRQKSVTDALGKARYRPRFEDGKPVETTGVRYRQDLFYPIKDRE